MNSLQKQKNYDLFLGIVGLHFLDRWLKEFKSHFGKEYFHSPDDEQAAIALEKLSDEITLFDTAHAAWDNPQGFYCVHARSLKGFYEHYQGISTEVDGLKPKAAPVFRQGDKDAYKESVVHQAFDQIPLPAAMKDDLHKIQEQGEAAAREENQRWKNDPVFREEREKEYTRRTNEYIKQKLVDEELYKTFRPSGLAKTPAEYALEFAQEFPHNVAADTYAWNHPYSDFARTYANAHPKREFSVRYKEKRKLEYPETQFHDNS